MYFGEFKSPSCHLLFYICERLIAAHVRNRRKNWLREAGFYIKEMPPHSLLPCLIDCFKRLGAWLPCLRTQSVWWLSIKYPRRVLGSSPLLKPITLKIPCNIQVETTDTERSDDFFKLQF